MGLHILLFFGGLLILLAGADFLVRGAAALAQRFQVPPILAGLTLVAFGTSAPELVVNVFSAVQGSSELALGNIMGSNIANILLILGLAAIVRDLEIQKNTTWKEIPFAALALVILWAMSEDKYLDGQKENHISRSDSISLVGFFTIFVYYSLSLTQTWVQEIQTSTLTIPLNILLIIGGLLGLFYGGKLVVEEASALAKNLGFSENFIGLTVVAIGTSLPELATSLIAAFRGQVDIAVGNVVGSNIFNVFWILGITGIIRPLVVTEKVQQDILFCLFATFLLFALILFGKRYSLRKRDGLFMLVLYMAYLTFRLFREGIW